MAEINGKTIETERDFTFSEAEYNEMLEQSEAERTKRLRRHKLPEERKLKNALLAMTKPELEDIRFNLNLPEINVARVKKDELAEELEREVVNFAGRWFVSICQEQKDWFDYACQHEGLLTGIQKSENHKLDYLQGVGIMFCGMSEGELVWYMPEEIQAEYAKLNNGAFADAVNVNTEVMRLLGGMAYYYGIADYDTLYRKIKELIDGDLDFADFMGIVFNGSCWYPYIVPGKQDLMHESLMNPEALQQARSQRPGLDYADIPYDKLYDAGQEGYMESTEAYRALAQYFMNSKKLDVLAAAQVVESIYVILQNGYGMKEIMGLLSDNNLAITEKADKDVFLQLLSDYNDTMHQWVLKGHTPEEAANMQAGTFVRQGPKVGRNDPCPCGSGKKYKNCCLKKEY